MSRTTIHDGELVQRVLAGQRDSFGEIVARYERPLHRLAESRLNDPELARDAVQETFLNALRSLPGYDARYSFRTWLWTILLNVCKRLGKRESRAAVWSGQAANDASAAADVTQSAVCPQAEPAAQASAREQSQLLHRCLNALPEGQADALRLRFFGELTFPEIAAALECSVLTAKNRVRAGLARLAFRLRQGEQSAVEQNLQLQHLSEHPMNRHPWQSLDGEALSGEGLSGEAAPHRHHVRRGGAEL